MLRLANVLFPSSSVRDSSRFGEMISRYVEYRSTTTQWKSFFRADMGSIAPSQSLCSRTLFIYDCNTRPTYHHAMARKGSAVIDTSAIMGNVLVIRGHRVLLDSDLAALYQVET